jgi:periplasmic protein TonB
VKRFFQSHRRLALTLLALVVIVLLVILLQPRVDTARRLHDKITAVILPPPPPPPPPPPEKPPEPQKLKELKPDTPNEPEKKVEDQPPDEALQAREGPGANEFGVSAGNGNGMKIGGGSGGGGFGAYARVVQRELQALLEHDKRTKKGRYLILLNVWLTASGGVERAEIVSSEGDRRLNDAVSEVVAGLTVSQLPPQDMPQPVRLRIGAREM